LHAANDHPTILFTAFEPSGDDHASSVIAELRRRHPDLPMFAWGGPKMAKAGAEVVEQTGRNAVIGLPGLAKIREHRQINQRINRWVAEHPPTLHVPVDSPAANFPICKITKKSGAKVVHLVAPQIWAWGGWRIHKLRRLTDKVLCLLPFEAPWFRERGIDAEFIGHPLFDTPPGAVADDAFGSGEPKIALMPGSRPAEWARNFPLMVQSFRDLRARFQGAVGAVAATTPEVAQRLRQIADEHGGWPEGLTIVSGQADQVITWCDMALVVSGTVTLQIAKQTKPMVIFYKTNPVMYTLLARWLLSTEFYSLPNLIAGHEIVPELMPHFDDDRPITAVAIDLLNSPERLRTQREELGEVVAKFQGRHAAVLGADAIEKMIGIG